jgi:hemolysin III
MYYGEKFNAATHFLGALLALGGTALLIVLAWPDQHPWKLASVIVYGITLMSLYSFSTLYHSVRGPIKTILQKLDHVSIYLLIAGSYTPFCLVTLQGSWGWWLLGVVWGLALLGIAQEFRAHNGARVLSIVIYIVMGWAALAALVPLRQALGPAGFAWVAAGGVFYTAGIVFFIIDTRLRHAHGVWHLFVLAGSMAHYFAIYRYVL